MIYSDVSCTVAESLKKLEELRIDKLLKIDFFALLTITEKRKILMEGALNYSNVGQKDIMKSLQEMSQDIYQSDDAKICRFSGQGQMNAIIVPIRAQDHYKVFSVCCSFNGGYDNRDLDIMKSIIKLTYDNVLLDNVVMKERDYLVKLFSSIDAAIVSFDLDGVISTANEAVKDVFDVVPGEIIGRRYDQVFLAEEDKSVERIIKEVLESKKILNVRNRLFSKNVNGEKYIDIAYCPINDNKSQAAGVMLFARDITKLKIYERQIGELEQFAVLGELAAGVAHNLRNPLMSIRGCAKILGKKLSRNPEFNEYIEPIITEVDKADEKIKQMLSYSFITKEDLYSRVDVNEVLEKCYNVVSFQNESKYINIEKELSKDLPLITGNNVQLQQAFLNILFNAIQAIDREGTIRIGSEDLQEESRVLVSISDDGKGMCMDEIDRIFTPFYTTKSGGTGLGLSIVKRVIEKYGGDIEVDFEREAGTEFKVYLPY